MGKTTKDDANALADLVELFLASLDDEMEHGHYGPPDTVPLGHDDEDDYFEEHDKIVTKTANLRLLVQGLIDKIRGGGHA